MAANRIEKMLRRLSVLALLPLLAACVDDRTATEVGGNQLLTLIREQKLPWSDEVDLSIVVARMPTCQRRHDIGKGSPQTKIELWQYRPDVFILKVGDRHYVTETYSCEGLDRLKELPAEGLGQQLGTYQNKDGKFAFVAAPREVPAAAPAPAPAPPAATTPAVAPAPAAPPAAVAPPR